MFFEMLSCPYVIFLFSSTNIQSTVCLPCPPNTYMDEDAHSHRRCKEADGFCREDQDQDPVFEPTRAPK